MEAAPCPHLIGIDAVLASNTGDRRAGLECQRDDGPLPFRGMSASLPFRRDLDCLRHSVPNSYRGHDRSFVSFAGHHGTRHRAFTDRTGLVLTNYLALSEFAAKHRATADAPAAFQELV